jgi:hypothetical protein
MLSSFPCQLGAFSVAASCRVVITIQIQIRERNEHENENENENETGTRVQDKSNAQPVSASFVLCLALS